MDIFDDFHFKPHFDHDGHLKGFTQKDFFGKKQYFDNDGKFKGYKFKNHFTNKSDYYDSSNKHLGSSIHKINGHDFLKSDGTLGHTPKMFELKDPNFHKNVHDYFSNQRAHLITKIR